jgi:hypothetical protein
VPNEMTAEVKALARQYGPVAIAELARLATKESEAARVAASRSCLIAVMAALSSQSNER